MRINNLLQKVRAGVSSAIKQVSEAIAKRNRRDLPRSRLSVVRAELR